MGQVYLHRDSTLGNKIGRELFEDILVHKVSLRYQQHVEGAIGVVNQGGKIHTPKSIRRNDSVYGRPPVGALTRLVEGFPIPEGAVAEPRIGCEVKIIAKSQQKQIDRVINDLEGFARRMKIMSARCINVAVVGVNYESDYAGHEGGRVFRHQLKANEPSKVVTKLHERLIGEYDELLVFAFRATNQPPYPFAWIDGPRANLDYGAALARIGEEYQHRF